VAEARSTVDALAGDAESESVIQRELAEQAGLRALEVINDIQDALHRMNLESYGACERCGRSIAVARLEAIPHARQCVACPAGSPRLIG
jgi:DnaK suppressor protein